MGSNQILEKEIINIYFITNIHLSYLVRSLSNCGDNLYILNEKKCNQILFTDLTFTREIK